MKKVLKNPWTIGIGTTLLGFLLTVLYDVIKGENVFSTIWGVLTGIGRAVLYFLNIDLKVWWVITGLIAVVIILCFFVKYQESKSKHDERTDPPFFQYTNDRIQGWNWEWTWKKNMFDEYEIDNLHPVCEKCGTPLVRSENYLHLECMRCNKQYSRDLPRFERIKIYILDSAQRGLYPKGDKK